MVTTRKWYGPVQAPAFVGGHTRYCGGNTYFVDANATNANDNNAGTDPDAPFATLEGAYDVCAADKGDVIYVLPAHTETLTGAPCLTLDTAGVTIIGLGTRTKRPTFLVDAAATAYVSISAADVHLENLIFKAGHADIAKCVNVTAAGAAFVNCDFVENTTGENFLICILTSNAGDDLLVEGCRLIQPDASNTEGIEIVGGCDRVVLRDNYIHGPFTVSCVSITTAACKDLLIVGNYLFNNLAGDDLAGCLDIVASSTGIISDNRCYMEDNTDILTAIDGANCGRLENYCANEYGQEGDYSATQSA